MADKTLLSTPSLGTRHIHHFSCKCALILPPLAAFMSSTCWAMCGAQQCRRLLICRLLARLLQVLLNIGAQAGVGSLLGNLLCDVANLLNPGTGLSAVVSRNHAAFQDATLLLQSDALAMPYCQRAPAKDTGARPLL